MTHMRNTQDVEQQYNEQDHNISMQPNKEIFYKLNRVDDVVEAGRFELMLNWTNRWLHKEEFHKHAP